MRIQRAVSLALMVLYLGGCYSWRVQPFVPDQFVEVKQPSRIRVTTSNGEQLVLNQPRVRNDSIVGRGDAGMTGVPVSSVEQIETSSSNAGKAVLLGVGVASTVALVVWLMSDVKTPPGACIPPSWCP